MQDNRIGSLIATDQDDKVVGIITERDIIFDCIAPGKDPATLTVSDIMTGDIVSVDPDASINDADNLMAAHGVRHIPIVDDGKPVGMISARDVLSARLGVVQDMKEAAEQIALLSKNVRKLDLQEILDRLDDELPSVFGAERWALHLTPEGHGGDRKALTRKTNCSCGPQALADLAECIAPTGDMSQTPAGPSEVCDRAAADGCRAIAPLNLSNSSDDESETNRISSYLCMCGLPKATDTSQEVFLYKLGLVADILTVNFANARLYRAAYRDPLTGLRTRRALAEALANEHSRGLKHGSTFCVAMLDVDNFKDINDTYGHASGDDVMRQLGTSLQAAVRAQDIVVRHGGDEVAVLMPQTTLQEAQDVTERIRYRVRQELYTTASISITVSCGLAQWSGESDEAPATVVRRADGALYEAKRAGRDCVVADTGCCYTRRI
jgi:diguanylate cyclase (GGDEF)-like protein